jgi:integrase
VPITDDVLAILKRRAAEAGGPYLFAVEDPNKPRSDYRNVLKHADARAGIPYGYDGLTMYDARRTAVNEMLDQGHSPCAVGDTLGHSVETMVKHYTRSTREQRRRAVESAGQSVHALPANGSDVSQSSQSSKDEKDRQKAAGK